MSDFETIRYAVEGGLARLTLNRPEAMNAMTNLMVSEARQALETAAGDSSIRVLVLTGAGRSFSPGADLNHFSAGRDSDVLTVRDFEAASLLHEMPALTVAAINGPCAGAGLGWALACDLRLMAAGARLNTAFLDVAVAGDMGVPWSLARLIGASRARELSFLPRKVDAAEAASIGLVARVFPDDNFAAETEAVLTGLLQKSPDALLQLKANYLAAEGMGFGQFVAFEAERHLRIVGSDNTREAFRAFIEKRPPRFT